jgi:hypothetical protein
VQPAELSCPTDEVRGCDGPRHGDEYAPYGSGLERLPALRASVVRAVPEITDGCPIAHGATEDPARGRLSIIEQLRSVIGGRSQQHRRFDDAPADRAKLLDSGSAHSNFCGWSVLVDPPTRRTRTFHTTGAKTSYERAGMRTFPTRSAKTTHTHEEDRGLIRLQDHLRAPRFA